MMSSRSSYIIKNIRSDNTASRLTFHYEKGKARNLPTEIFFVFNELISSNTAGEKE